MNPVGTHTLLSKTNTNRFEFLPQSLCQKCQATSHGDAVRFGVHSSERMAQPSPPEESGNETPNSSRTIGALFCLIAGSLENQRWEEPGRRSQEVRRSEKRKSERQEDAGARKGRKVAIHCVFQMIWDSGGLKSNLAKAAGAEPAGQMRDEKLHAVVARSTFPSQNVQNIRGSDHFWKLRCRKSARRCGAKHISKSKCTKHHVWTTFSRSEVEKVHAVVARSTFPSQKCKKLRVLSVF